MVNLRKMPAANMRFGVNRTKKTNKKFRNRCFLQRCWAWRHFSVPRRVYEEWIQIFWTINNNYRQKYRLADAPSQAHLQGTQSRHTKANLAKELALCQRFRDTPYFGGHRLSIQITKTKGEHTTGSLLLCWLTNIFSASYRYQPISSRRNSISFCCYLHH